MRRARRVAVLDEGGIQLGAQLGAGVGPAPVEGAVVDEHRISSVELHRERLPEAWLRSK